MEQCDQNPSPPYPNDQGKYFAPSSSRYLFDNGLKCDSEIAIPRLWLSLGQNVNNFEILGR